MSQQDPKKILIVDDSRVSRMMVGTFIKSACPTWQIIEADNAADALTLVEAIHPDYMTLDVNMPGISGLEAAEKLVKDFPSTKIVLLTANVQDAVRNRAVELGIGFAPKPINKDTVDKVLEFFAAQSGK